jgi:mannitol/fructose-specific phosphotransferase system IIA component (Ntr-type)
MISKNLINLKLNTDDKEDALIEMVNLLKKKIKLSQKINFWQKLLNEKEKEAPVLAGELLFLTVKVKQLTNYL